MSAKIISTFWLFIDAGTRLVSPLTGVQGVGARSALAILNWFKSGRASGSGDCWNDVCLRQAEGGLKLVPLYRFGNQR